MKNFKKIACLLIASLMGFSVAACAEELEETPDPDESGDEQNQQQETVVDDSFDYQGSTVAEMEAKGYTLTWADEFDGDTLNEAYWTHQVGNGGSEGIYGWGNNEKQVYRAESTSLADGIMTITASIQGSYICSSRIITRDKFEFTYGRVEARMKLPAGQGFWPAFWLLPSEDNPYGSWPTSGEIDIMEARGRVTNTVSGALHYGTPHQYQTQSYIMEQGETIMNWHVYALEWEEDEIRWYCDDELYFTATTWSSNAAEYPAPFDSDFYILFNLAVGGTFDNNLQPTIDMYPAEMKVDYVRVYSIGE